MSIEGESPLTHVRRLFRADTPLDAFCAAVVARYLPSGYNVLGICSDKGWASSDKEWRFAFSVASAAYEWDAIVDISGTRLVRHLHERTNGIRRLLDTRGAIEALERRLTTAFKRSQASRPGALVDELYITLPSHGDVKVLCQLLSSAALYYYPHTFMSPLKSEILAQAGSLADGVEARPPLVDRAKDLIKEVLFGAELRPVRKLSLAGIYSFSSDGAWPGRTVDLGHLVTKGLMAELFSLMPETIRDHWCSLGEAAGPRSCVVFLSPPVREVGQPDPDELTAYKHVVTSGVDASGASGILVKPHPRSSREWSDAVLDALRKVSSVPLIDASRHGELPAEVLLAPVKLAACTGLASSALISCARIYGVQAVLPWKAQEVLAARQGYTPELMDAWRRSAEPLVTII